MTGQTRAGVTYGLIAYGLWGVFPLYFRLLHRSGAVEILIHRVLWSLVVCFTAVVLLRRLGRLARTLRDRRTATWLLVAAVVVAINWGVYIYAVNSDQVIEASLGYFINPLVTVLLGVVLLRERLRRLQWVAVGVGALAVVVLTVDYGHLPVIALVLAVSFGTYGLCKNRVGGSVDALTGLTTETLLLAPVGIVALTFLESTGRGTVTENAPWQGLLLASSGFITVLPLLLFAAAASRVPLSLIGLMQYVTPTLQFLCGVLILGEHMPTSRWIGFGLVWIALVVLTTDGLRHARRPARSAARAAGEVGPTGAPDALQVPSGA